VVLALVTVPVYLRLVGVERFGVLSIAWLLLGYFGLFDLGLGRATAYRISALLRSSPQDRANTYFAAIATNLLFGAVGAVVLWVLSALFFNNVFKIDPRLRDELSQSLPWLACAVPIATMGGVLTGALQGREKFLHVNIVSIVSTTLFQLFPLLVAYFVSTSLPNLLFAAVLARVVALAVLAYDCHVEFVRGNRFSVPISEIRALLGYGSWITLTSMFGPLLVIVDRFVIGAVLGAASVTVYTIPFQMAQRIAVIPTALTNAMFPRLASASPSEQRVLSLRAIEALLCLLGVPVFLAIAFLPWALKLWVGPKVGGDAAMVGRFLVLGFWINAFALVPYAKLQASGRPDIVTKILLAEIPPYLLMLYLGMRFWGIVGSAVAFAVRCAADFVLLTVFSRSSLQRQPTFFLQATILTLSAVAPYLPNMPGSALLLFQLTCFGVLLVSTLRVMPREWGGRLGNLARLYGVRY
jgi:O-antigen/teichoic acid export membrane protein